jgi:hypothetical protein
VPGLQKGQAYITACTIAQHSTIKDVKKKGDTVSSYSTGFVSDAIHQLGKRGLGRVSRTDAAAGNEPFLQGGLLC